MAEITTTTAALGGVTQAFLQQGREMEEENEGREIRRNTSHPKKRAVLLTAFIVCISFLIFIANILSSLINNLVENDRVWNHLGLWINATKCAVKTNKSFSLL